MNACCCNPPLEYRLQSISVFNSVSLCTGMWTKCGKVSGSSCMNASEPSLELKMASFYGESRVKVVETKVLRPML